jgi:hypothetical protein
LYDACHDGKLSELKDILEENPTFNVNEDLDGNGWTLLAFMVTMKLSQFLLRIHRLMSIRRTMLDALHLFDWKC